MKCASSESSLWTRLYSRLTQITPLTVGAVIKDALCKADGHGLAPGLKLTWLTFAIRSPQTRTGKRPISIVRTFLLSRGGRIAAPCGQLGLTLVIKTAVIDRDHVPLSANDTSSSPPSADSGLKRFIKDRQAKHQWDDADEADFIRGALWGCFTRGSAGCARTRLTPFTCFFTRSA